MYRFPDPGIRRRRLPAAHRRPGGVTSADRCRARVVGLLLAAAAVAPAALAEGAAGCTAPAASWRPAELVRDLVEVEAVSGKIVAMTKKLCAAIQAFDHELAAEHAAVPKAAIERLVPRRKDLLFEGAAGRGELVAPARQGCFGGRESLSHALDLLTLEWQRVDRCKLKPFRIELEAGPEEGRRAAVQFIYGLGGTEAGGRTYERGGFQTEMVEGDDGRWRIARLVWGEAERFHSWAPAYADRTEAAGLPVDWTDAGYDPKDLGDGQVLYGGVSVGDVDGDGWLDVYVSRSGPNLLLLNDGAGGFREAAGSGTEDPGNGQTALFADLDGDGDSDLFVVNAWYRRIEGEASRRGHRLYRNRGDGTFEDAGELGPVGPASGATAADYDRDGRLDLYVTYYQDQDLVPYHSYVEARDGAANRLYRNLGGFAFEEVAERAGVADPGWSYAAAWADADLDGDPDLYVANDFGPNTLYRNRGDGGFDVWPAAADPGNGMSADWGDYDNDGRFDVYVANMYSKTGNQFVPLALELDEETRERLLFAVGGNGLWRNGGDDGFDEQARDLGAAVAGWAWGANFLDYDNDGWLDLHVANGFWAGAAEDDA